MQIFWCLLVSMLGVTGGTDWCYKSQVSCENKCKGPDEWKDIASTCGNKSQSPVNIVTKRVVTNNLTSFRFQGYQHAFHSIITNNGHTVKVNLSVLGFLYQESESANKKYESIINALPNITLPGNKSMLGPVSLDMLIPSHDTLMRYFRYKGSLTTPDCAESVIWTVFENTVKLSKMQLSAFSDLRFENGTAMTETFRPVQPLNGRDIFYSGSNTASVSTVLVVSTLIISFLTL
ncbi:hypothetical protein PGIGA_G00053160 [Pangasianodon gigas]|uniref:Uncharacterized protein n=1 Tax=Pangasianodon gigas TaxID=30993 RepID=A0ACC5X343_PANGG|nr:hypothetical protein [Pangasianodon gigas]